MCATPRPLCDSKPASLLAPAFPFHAWARSRSDVPSSLTRCKRLSNALVPLCPLQPSERLLAAQVLEREACAPKHALNVLGDGELAKAEHPEDEARRLHPDPARPSDFPRLPRSIARLRGYLAADVLPADPRSSWRDGFCYDDAPFVPMSNEELVEKRRLATDKAAHSAAHRRLAMEAATEAAAELAAAEAVAEEAAQEEAAISGAVSEQSRSQGLLGAISGAISAASVRAAEERVSVAAAALAEAEAAEAEAAICTDGRASAAPSAAAGGPSYSDGVCHFGGNLREGDPHLQAADPAPFLAALEAAEVVLPAHTGSLTFKGLNPGPTQAEVLSAWWLRSLLLHQYANSRSVPSPLSPSADGESAAAEYPRMIPAALPWYRESASAGGVAAQSADGTRAGGDESVGMVQLRLGASTKAAGTSTSTSASTSIEAEEPTSVGLLVEWVEAPSDASAACLASIGRLGVDRLRASQWWGGGAVEAAAEVETAEEAAAVSEGAWPHENQWESMGINGNQWQSEGAWPYEVRPTPPRLAAVRGFVEQLLEARRARWALPPGGEEAEEAHEAAFPLDGGYAELLDTLGYTILARVAHAAQEEEAEAAAREAHADSGGSGGSSSGSGSGSDDDRRRRRRKEAALALRVSSAQLALERDLASSAPMRALVHACRLAQLSTPDHADQRGAYGPENAADDAKYRAQGEAFDLSQGCPQRVLAGSKVETEAKKLANGFERYVHPISPVRALLQTGKDDPYLHRDQLTGRLYPYVGALGACSLPDTRERCRERRLGWDFARSALLRRETFSMMLVAMLHVHGVGEAWIVVRLFALVVVARAAMDEIDAIQGGVDYDHLEDADEGSWREDKEAGYSDDDEARSLLQLLVLGKVKNVEMDGDVELGQRVGARVARYLGVYWRQARALCALLGVPPPPPTAGGVSSSAPAGQVTDANEVAQGSAKVEAVGAKARPSCAAVLAALGAPSLSEMVTSKRLRRLLSDWFAATWTVPHGTLCTPDKFRRREFMPLGGSLACDSSPHALRTLPRPLHELPLKFTDLFKRVAAHKCPVTREQPTDPAVCLVCGAMLCAGSACCKRGGRGALTQHVQQCSGGAGVFFLVHRCGTVLLRGPHAAYSLSPYVDDFGEEDSGLRRGRPLHLDAERMRHLERLWASHAISGEVARERMMRDRVIRDNFY